MKKNINRIMLTLFCLTAILTACTQDEIDVKKSIFNTEETELRGFDKWLDDNFRLSYNIQFRYKYQDLETDMNYNLIPAKEGKASQMAQLLKFLWLDAYTEVVGIEFMRSNAPRLIYLVGSPAWKTASKTQGTAENGLKITLYNINEFSALEDIEQLNRDYFKTMHHEFAHLLHQKKMFDLKFGDWSGAMYVGSSWSNYSDAEAAAGGLVSTYASSNIYEDFVEVVAYYITYPDSWWEEWYELAGEEGTAIIKNKIEFVKEYMETWGIDLDKLRMVVRRRTAEASNLELITEF